MSFSGDALMTVVISAGALLAVSVPLYRGLRLCLQARAVTRRLDRSELKRALGAAASTSGVEPLAVLMARVLVRSLKENSGDGMPREFVYDATKQFVMNEYDSHYERPISMFANLLPPIGFIGTTGGLLILFLSMHLADASLELGALAVALTSSVFALMGFAALEAMKIRLYGRLLHCLDDVVSLQRAAGERAPASV